MVRARRHAIGRGIGSPHEQEIRRLVRLPQAEIGQEFFGEIEIGTFEDHIGERRRLGRRIGVARRLRRGQAKALASGKDLRAGAFVLAGRRPHAVRRHRDVLPLNSVMLFLPYIKTSWVAFLERDALPIDDVIESATLNQY